MNEKLDVLDLIGSTGVYGQSESGKTYFAKKMLEKAKPRCTVIIDPQSREGCDAAGVLGQLEANVPIIVCNSLKRDEQLKALFYAVGHSTEEEPVYVIADEASTYMDKKDDGLSLMILQGRHGHFGICFLTQRPSDIYAQYRTQAKATYWFKLSEHTDVGTAFKAIGQRAYELENFKQGEYVRRPEL